MIHTVKGFGIVNKAEVDGFLEFSCSFYDPMDVGNLISGSSAFTKSILNIWKFTVNILFKPGLDNFEHYFANMWDECNCAVVWAFFGIGTAFLRDWKLTFSSPVATAEFSKFAGILSAALPQHHLSGFEIAQLEFHPVDGLYSSWNSPGQNTGVGSLSLLQGIFPTQGSNPDLLHCRWLLYQLSHQGSPKTKE